MPNFRPIDLPALPSGTTLVDSDEIALSRPSGLTGANASTSGKDFGVTLKQLSTYVPDGDPGGGPVGKLDDLTDVTAPTPTNRQVLRYNGTAWVNATIAADTVTLQVSDAVGVAPPSNPSDPLTGSTPTPTNAFKRVSQALDWARQNLRITSGLTLNIASGNYQSEPAAWTAGGDGYQVTLQGAAGGGTVINDTTGTTTAGGFLTTQGRVTLNNITVTSRRFALFSQRGCSTIISGCTFTNNDGNQAVQGSDMQLRFVGTSTINGFVVLDFSLSLGANVTLNINTDRSPALTFRGNADCVWASGARIGFVGTGRTVQIENVSGIRTDSAVWLGGPTFNYITVQPVRSDIAGLPNGSSKVLNMVVVAALPGNPDPNTFYAIP